MKKLTEKEKIKQKEWSKYTLEHKWYAQRNAIKDDEKEDFEPLSGCILCKNAPKKTLTNPVSNDQYEITDCSKCLCPEGICMNSDPNFIDKFHNMNASEQDYMMDHWDEDDWDKALEYTEAIIRLFEANIKE